MKRLVFVLAAIALLATPALADVTVTMTVTVTTGQMAVDGTMTSLVKGGKFRADTTMAGQTFTLLSDAATKQQWMINHATKQIEPFNPSQALAGMPLAVGDVKVSVAPNGQTKEILGRACQGYTVDMSMPMTIGGETITLKTTGASWVAKDGAGLAEFSAAQKAFTSLGMSTSPMGQGPQGKAMSEIWKALGDAGVVMEQDFRMTMEGTGQMAQMLGQMGQMVMATKVTAVSTDAIPDAKFALPEGYAKK